MLGLGACVAAPASAQPAGDGDARATVRARGTLEAAEDPREGRRATGAAAATPALRDDALVLSDLFVDDAQWRSLSTLGETPTFAPVDAAPTGGAARVDGGVDRSGATAREPRPFRGSIDVDLVTALITDRAKQVALRAVADAIRAATGPGGDRRFVADLLAGAEGLLTDGTRLQRNRVEALVTTVVRVVLAEVLVRTRFPETHRLGRPAYWASRLCPRRGEGASAARRGELSPTGREVCRRLRVAATRRSVLGPAVGDAVVEGPDQAPMRAADPDAPTRLLRADDERSAASTRVHLYLLDLAYWRIGSTAFFGDVDPRPPSCPWGFAEPGRAWCRFLVEGADDATRDRRLDWVLRLDPVLDGLLVARELRAYLRDRGVGLRGLVAAVLDASDLGAFGETPGLTRGDWDASLRTAGDLRRWTVAAVREVDENPDKPVAGLLRDELLSLADVADEIGLAAADRDEGGCLRRPGRRGDRQEGRVHAFARQVCALERRLAQNYRRLEDRLWPLLRVERGRGADRDPPVPLADLEIRGMGTLLRAVHALAEDGRALDRLLEARRRLATIVGPEPSAGAAPGPDAEGDDDEAIPIYGPPGPEDDAPSLLAPPDDPEGRAAAARSARALRGTDRVVRLFGAVDYHSARQGGVSTYGGAARGVGSLGAERADGTKLFRLVEILEPVLEYLVAGRPAPEGVLFRLVAEVEAEDLLLALGYGGREEDACGGNEESLACWVVRIVLSLKEATSYSDEAGIRVDGAILRDTLAALGDDFRSQYRWRPFFHLTIGLGALATFRAAPGAGPDAQVDGVLVQPVVAEQIGIGAASPALGGGRFTFKAGAYASGILYRIVFDSEESDAVLFGAFAALDLYELLELYVAPSLLLFPADDANRAAVRFGLSLGVQVPLGDYLSRL